MRRRRKGQLLLFSLITLLICEYTALQITQSHFLISPGVAYFATQSDETAGHYEQNLKEEKINLALTHTLRKNFSKKCMPYRNRLQHYCHTSLLEPRNVEFTQEGRFSHNHPEFQSVNLVHAHVIIRHGDRSSVIAKPEFGHPRVNLQCGVGDVVHRSEMWGAHRPNHWEGLRDFPPLSPVGDGSRVRHKTLSLHPGPASQACGVGELTTRGYLQLHNLGTLLQMSYGQLFPGMDMNTDLYIQSTDYARTIRSAGAFVLGFIPSVPQLRKMIKIHVQPGSVNQAPPEGIPLTYKPCRALLGLRETENVRVGYYEKEKEYRWMYDKVVNFFNLSVYPGTPWTELFDQFLTRGCHMLDTDTLLPCTENGACIDCSLGREMFDYADWSMASKYPPNSSLVAMTPFLKHSLLEPIETIIAGNQPSLKYRVMLTFTHDSTLNQLLKALRLPAKSWLPYAARLSFELWRTTNFLDESRYFLRVLLNGKIVTHEFPFAVDNTSEIVEFEKFKSNVVPIDTWAYNKLCGN